MIIRMTGILDRVYANLHRDSLFELRDSNDGIFDLFCAQIYIAMCNLCTYTVQNTVIRMIIQIAQFE